MLRLVVLVDASASALAAFPVMRDDVLNPIIDRLGKYTQFEVALVLFFPTNCTARAPLHRSPWTSDLNQFARWLESVPSLAEGAGRSAVHSALAEALYLFQLPIPTHTVDSQSPPSKEILMLWISEACQMDGFLQSSSARLAQSPGACLADEGIGLSLCYGDVCRRQAGILMTEYHARLKAMHPEQAGPKMVAFHLNFNPILQAYATAVHGSSIITDAFASLNQRLSRDINHMKRQAVMRRAKTRARARPPGSDAGAQAEPTANGVGTPPTPSARPAGAGPRPGIGQAVAAWGGAASGAHPAHGPPQDSQAAVQASPPLRHSSSVSTSVWTGSIMAKVRDASGGPFATKSVPMITCTLAASIPEGSSLTAVSQWPPQLYAVRQVPKPKLEEAIQAHIPQPALNVLRLDLRSLQDHQNVRSSLLNVSDGYKMCWQVRCTDAPEAVFLMTNDKGELAAMYAQVPHANSHVVASQPAS